MIHTLNPHSLYHSTGAAKYLENFFHDRTLLLQDQDTAIGHAWPGQIERIEKFVADHDIQVIVHHAGVNPVRLDHAQEFGAPTFLKMQKELSQLATTYTLTGDFSYYYNPVPGIVFFPVFLWLNSTRRLGEFLEHRANTVHDIEFESKTKGLLCLNRNAVWHRIYLFSLLAGKPWFDRIGYSFRAVSGHQLDLAFGDRLKEHAIAHFMTADELALAESFANLLPITVPEDTRLGSRLSSIHGELYRSYAINLVTETSLTEGVMLSEKTCKPFMSYQIPILIAPVGANQFLEDLGLDMFADYIPWQTWDHVADHKLRIRLIVDFVDKLLAEPDAEQAILSTHRDFKSRLIKNKEYFHSTEFQDRLLKQLVLPGSV
jgi:hypothetical protein